MFLFLTAFSRSLRRMNAGCGIIPFYFKGRGRIDYPSLPGPFFFKTHSRVKDHGTSASRPFCVVIAHYVREVVAFNLSAWESAAPTKSLRSASSQILFFQGSAWMLCLLCSSFVGLITGRNEPNEHYWTVGKRKKTGMLETKPMLVLVILWQHECIGSSEDITDEQMKLKCYKHLWSTFVVMQQIAGAVPLNILDRHLELLSSPAPLSARTWY